MGCLILTNLLFIYHLDNEPIILIRFSLSSVFSKNK